MKIKLNPLTAVIFIISYFMYDIKLLAITYAVMAAHEAAHFIAAICIGLKPDSVEFGPFGVHLRLRNKIVRSLADEIILYAAGPLFNGMAAAISAAMGYERLYVMNVVLFVMNMLPVMPLDGGVIAKRILSYRIGTEAAKAVMRGISLTAALLFALLSAAMWYNGKINISVIAMSVFLLGNVITAREKYDVDFINAVSGARKRTNRVKLVVVDSSHNMLDAAKGLSPEYTTIAAVESNGKITEFLTEDEIINSAAGTYEKNKKRA